MVFRVVGLSTSAAKIRRTLDFSGANCFLKYISNDLLSNSFKLLSLICITVDIALRGGSNRRRELDS